MRSALARWFGLRKPEPHDWEENRAIDLVFGFEDPEYDRAWSLFRWEPIYPGLKVFALYYCGRGFAEWRRDYYVKNGFDPVVRRTFFGFHRFKGRIIVRLTIGDYFFRFVYFYREGYGGDF